MRIISSWIMVLILASCGSQKPVVTTDSIVSTVKEEIVPSSPVVMTETIPGTEVQFQMTKITGGKFLMGSPENELHRTPDEGPQFEVSVGDFWMGTYEVGFEEYDIFRNKERDFPPPNNPEWDGEVIARPSPPYEDPTFGHGKKNVPAVSMTQYAALQYCKWLSDKSGSFYRLPSEAEWEYACKAGSTSPYYFGTDEVDLDAHAWHFDNSMEKYHEKGEKLANPWGLHDMLGNVSEWTLDQYKADAYTTLSTEMAGKINPWINPTRLHPRTVRGGSWDDDKSDHRCSCRIESSPKWKERDPQIPKSFWWNTDSPFVGFRIIKPIPQPSKEEQQAFWELVFGDG